MEKLFYNHRITINVDAHLVLIAALKWQKTSLSDKGASWNNRRGLANHESWGQYPWWHHPHVYVRFSHRWYFDLQRII